MLVCSGRSRQRCRIVEIPRSGSFNRNKAAVQPSNGDRILGGSRLCANVRTWTAFFVFQCSRPFSGAASACCDEGPSLICCRPLSTNVFGSVSNLSNPLDLVSVVESGHRLHCSHRPCEAIRRTKSTIQIIWIHITSIGIKITSDSVQINLTDRACHPVRIHSQQLVAHR